MNKIAGMFKKTKYATIPVAAAPKQPAPKGKARLRAAERIALLADENSFSPLFENLSTRNPLSFEGYDEKIALLRETTGLTEGVVTGECEIGGMRVCLGVMDSAFLMGSMGSVVGERLTLLFEHAARRRLPVIVVCASGGARMHEGIFSLMQMAKVTGAVQGHSDAGLLYISVLTDPTTGGVTASFAMLSDIIIAEPKAMIGFAGRRVIEGTISQTLPEDFQSAEFLKERGFIDLLCPPDRLRETIKSLLTIHREGGGL